MKDTTRSASVHERGNWKVTAFFVGVLVIAVTAMPRPGSAAHSLDVPKFEEVAQVVDAYFSTLEDFEPNDLIRRSQVESVLTLIADRGWEVAEADKIAELALPDDSFLVKQLSTAQGQRFMRKISRHSGAYARLDRLSTIRGGTRVVRQLIEAKGGDEMITYLATTQGGRNLGRQLAGAQHGVDLNKPTGRIYTVADLIVVLQRLHPGDATRR